MEFIFFATLFLYLFVVGALTDFVDYDFFARMIVGKTFFETGEVLKYDFLSYSKTHPWYDHEWGASLAFYFIQDNFGDVGLQLFKSILLLITFFFIVLIIKLRRKVFFPDKKFPILNFLFFFVCLQPIMVFIFSLRCHHFTFMFFAIWLYVLEKARLEKNYRILYCLPLLMIIWSNIHGGCFMGLGVTGLYIIGEFLNKKPVKPYILTLTASFLSMFINPYGIDYVLFLIKATTMTRPNILEWQSPFNKYFIFKMLRYKLFLLVFLVITFIRYRRSYKNLPNLLFKEKILKLWQNTDKTKFVLLFFMTLLTVKSARFISYYVFTVIPFCYDDFYSVFSKQLSFKLNRAKELFFFIFMLVTLALNILVKDFKYKNFHTIYPLSEIEFLIENEVRGNLFTPFETGSYASYKLYPNMFIFFDGRYEEVYDPSLNDVYAKTIAVGALGWREMLDSIHHDAIITYRNYALYENLKYHPDYYLVLQSQTFALYLRKDVYNNLKRPIRIPTDDPDFYQKILWQTRINWQK